MHAQPQCFGLAHRLGMGGAGIAIKHDIGDCMIFEDRRERLWPVGQFARKRKIPRRAPPKGGIASVKAHTPDRHARLAQHLPQLPKEGAVRALQEEKGFLD